MTNTRVHKGLTRKQKDNIVGTALAGIHYVGFAIFTLVPLVLSIIMAFCKFGNQTYDLGKMTFTGLDNFIYIFTEKDTLTGFELGYPLIWKALTNTLFLCLSVPFEIFFGLLGAWLLRSKIKFKKFFRVVFYMPNICSSVAIAFVWRYIFDKTDYGFLNQIIGMFGIPRQLWLYDENFLKICYIVMCLWSVLGYDMLLFQAALENINASIYEAADLDGASKTKQLFSITIPLVTPTVFFLLITCLIGALQSYAKMDSFATKYNESWGDHHSGTTLVAYIMLHKDKRQEFPYINIWDQAVGIDEGTSTVHGLGISAAATLFLMLLVAIVTFINLQISNKWVQYND